MPRRGRTGTAMASTRVTDGGMFGEGIDASAVEIGTARRQLQRHREPTTRLASDTERGSRAIQSSS